MEVLGGSMRDTKTIVWGAVDLHKSAHSLTVGTIVFVDWHLMTEEWEP